MKNVRYPSLQATVAETALLAVRFVLRGNAPAKKRLKKVGETNHFSLVDLFLQIIIIINAVCTIIFQTNSIETAPVLLRDRHTAAHNFSRLLITSRQEVILS